MKFSSIVITLIAVFLVLVAIEGGSCGLRNSRSLTKARMRKDAAHVDQIIKACKIYAMDYNGVYPTRVETEEERRAGLDFQNSTDAFNELIREVDLGTEDLFFVQGNPEKLLPPNQDGELVPEENCYIYVIGQSEETPAHSPLIADEMVMPGEYGENHPWLKAGRTIVGYCGGQVKIEKLTSKEHGATVRGAPGSGIEDIFQLAKEDEEGRITGGLLAVPRENILLPK